MRGLDPRIHRSSKESCENDGLPGQARQRQILEPRPSRRQQTMQANLMGGDFMRRWLLLLAMVTAVLWSVPAFAQQRSQLGPLCTSDNTPADRQIDACNKILALKVFSGEKLATIYFWRAVGWNKKGNYTQVIADATEVDQAEAGCRALQSARFGLLRQRRIR